jgi:hypothetical protein
MPKKTTHISSIAVRVTIKPDLVQVELLEGIYGYLTKPPILVFWVPPAALDRFRMVPEEIIKVRAKHEGITFDHYSYTTTAVLDRGPAFR